MSSADGADGRQASSTDVPDEPLDGQLNSLLTEALIHLLVEKGVLTRNDALSVVESAAQVRLGALHEYSGPPADADPLMQKLRRMYASFEALDGHPGVVETDGENVIRLRPPVHGDRPKFPRGD